MHILMFIGIFKINAITLFSIFLCLFLCLYCFANSPISLKKIENNILPAKGKWFQMGDPRIREWRVIKEIIVWIWPAWINNSCVWWYINRYNIKLKQTTIMYHRWLADNTVYNCGWKACANSWSMFLRPPYI